MALEALARAYEEVGDLPRARDYLVRLSAAVVEEADREAAEVLRDRLRRTAADDPALRQAADRLEQFLASAAAGTEGGRLSAAAVAPPTETEEPFCNLPAELSLAWSLYQAGELTEDEFAALLKDLAEIVAAKSGVTVSVLHLLHDRAYRNLERALVQVSRDARMPLIPLAAFDIPETAAGLLPLDFMERYGVMVFDFLGPDALAVVMNPYDKQLQKRVETSAGRKCHFFMTTPAEFDAVLERFKNRSARAGASANHQP